MAKRNMAIITVSKRALLDWLQFEGGEIHNVRHSVEHFGDIEILVEHPDLPEMHESDYLLRITPAYRFWKRGNFIKMVRIDPPKGVKRGK